MLNIILIEIRFVSFCEVKVSMFLTLFFAFGIVQVLQILHNDMDANNRYQKNALLMLFLMITIDSLYDEIQVSYSETNEGMYL